MKDGVISRIGRIEVDNIRGLVGSHSFDLDADLVILTGPNGFGKTSLIDAICLVLTGAVVGENKTDILLSHGKNIGSVKIYSPENDKETCIEIKVDSKKDGPELLSGKWTPFLNPQDVVRITSYSQEFLDQVLGDEEGQESILRKLLQPPPELIKKALQGIGQSLKDIDKRLRGWSAPGVEPEERIQKDRKEAIIAFRGAWIQSQKDVNTLPRLSTDAFLTLKSDNLRKNWEGELRNLTEEAVQRANLSLSVTKGDSPRNMLAVLKQCLKKIRDAQQRESKTTDTDIYHSVLNLLESLGKETTIVAVDQKISPTSSEAYRLFLPLTTHALQTVEKYIEGWKKEREDILQKIKKLYNIIEGTEDGQEGLDGLLRWLNVGKDNASHWIKIARSSMDDPPGPVPFETIQWLDDMLATLEKPFTQLEQWLEMTHERRQKLNTSLAQLERRINDQQNLIELGRLLVEQATRFQALKAKLLNLEQLTVETLRQAITEHQSQGSRHEPVTRERGFKELFEAIEKWHSVERRDDLRHRALEKHQAYKKIQEKIGDVQRALKAEQSGKGVLRSLQDVPPSIRDKFVNSVNVILNRFRLVPGITPIQIKTYRKRTGVYWKLRLADGRNSDSLSTGQRAQLGITTMIALNLSSSEILNHRILLFDDITTALDMAQLPRAAVLIRQLAYADSTREAFRRQVILSSHHEEMTHRLLDYLLPPPERTLKVVNFIGWDYDNGPSYEILEGKLRCDNLESITKLLERRFDQLWGEKPHKQR